MLCGGLSLRDFMHKLHKVLRPTGPVVSMELLFGREKHVTDLELALYATGRHAFIYGDRGVGKTSLAQTVAFKLQEDAEPILVGCEKESTFSSVMNDIILRGTPQDKKIDTQGWSFGLNVAGIGGINAGQNQKYNYPELKIDSVSAAVRALQFLTKVHSKIPYIVIDEFDQIDSDEERQKFGSLIKQLGDQACEVKLIFTGIGDSLVTLIGGHKSSERQIHQVHLDSLPWNGRFQIIDNAFDEFGLTVDDSVRYKIAGLSDGFPNYIHLICEKILLTCQSSIREYSSVDYNLFIKGLNDAIDSVSETLRQSYTDATEGRDESYKHILWAMSDMADLTRHKTHISESYVKICKSLDVTPLDKSTFERKFNALKKPTFGCIIIPALGNRPSWFRFRENMLRGYIRMRAEQHGLELDFQNYRVAGEHSARAIGKYSAYKPLTNVEGRVARLRGDNDWLDDIKPNPIK
ncbi:ATP-binding protein [Escherichia coli]|uniref:ATP-binding protein n=1 Tax=Escherichia coli TaxID=562 RepID=UPI00069ABC00|nr:ATP-binding protein [Escherichia coli]EEC7289715.1 ATP-binding protein [Escherichia coli]EER3651885.1 ATP-binding protein [Escherichia coli]EES0940892.1 ATP-binding protein [Escherichia coli]EES2038882.1 ATP-binding protein [Escherichia coli]EET2683163.1 ATP-binding protein [Escherichia coli]